MVVKKKVSADKDKKGAAKPSGRRVTKRQSNLEKSAATAPSTKPGKSSKRDTEKKQQSRKNGEEEQLEMAENFDSDDFALDDDGDEGDEKLVLPPLSPSNRIELMSNDQSSTRTTSSTSVLPNADKIKPSDESFEKRLSDARNQKGGNKTPIGILSQGLLTRRNIDGVDYHRGSLVNDYNSRLMYQRVLRGDSRQSNYERGLVPTERFYNSRYYNSGFGSAPVHKYRIAKERPSDKIVTFYRSFNSTQPELKFRVSRLNHRHLDDVIEELSRRVFLREGERYIHTSYGTIIGDVNEFEDGGVYFFGPPHVYDTMLYDNFRVANSPPYGSVPKFGDTVDAPVRQAFGRRGSRLSMYSFDNRSDGGSNFNHYKALQPLQRRKRLIKVIVNDDTNIMMSFMVDEAKHRTMYDVLADLTDQLRHNRMAFRSWRIDRICRHNGKVLQKIEELFLGVDDFYAFSVGYYSPQSSEPTYSTAPNSNNGSALNRTDLDHSGSYAGSYKKNPTTYNSSNVNNKNNNKNNSNNNKKVTGNTTENTPSNTNHAPTSTNQDDGSSRIKKNNAPINPTNRGPRVIPNDQPLYGSKLSKPVKVEILNNTHILDPPTHDYMDPAFIRTRDYHPKLHLEWVYGYNGTKCRNNILVLPSEELLYFVAKVAVIFNRKMQQQRFYTEHTDEICSISQHQNQWIIATGQVSGGFGDELSHVRIWDSKILVTLNTLNFEEMNLRIECMDFCQADNGVRLATLATQNEEWCLTVWDWEDAIKISSSDTYFDSEFNIKFDPNNKDQLITCGKEHVFFWDVSRDEAVYEIGYFNDYHTPKMITCVDFDENGVLITADSNGVIHIWDLMTKKTVSVINTVHHGTVISMLLLPGNHLITSSNFDRKLSLINYDDMIPSQAEIEIPEIYGSVVAIAPLFGGFRGSTEDFDYLKLAIGTSTNAILCGSLNEEFSCILKGPTAEMAGMDIHPNENVFITAGADRTVTLWSAASHSEIWEVTLDQPCSAVEFSPVNDVAIIGTTAGRWHVCNRMDGTQLASFQCDRSKITCISFSPDGEMLAIGMSSGNVFFYECNDALSYRFHSRCMTSHEEVVAIDWSLNGTLVRYMNANFELFHWDVADKRLEENRHLLRDVHFETDHVPISFRTAGVWIDKDEKEILWKAADRSRSSTMYVAGATSGSVRIYNYPCDIPTIQHIEKVDSSAEPYQQVDLHSTEVANVGFFPTDGVLLSNGLNDFAIAQWKIIRKVPSPIIDRRFQRRYPEPMMHSTRNRPIDLAASQSKFISSQRSVRQSGVQGGSLTAPRLTARGSVMSSHDYMKS